MQAIEPETIRASIPAKKENAVATLSISEFDLPDDELLRRILTAVAAHPEVREPLLRVLLTEEFLNLPTEVKELREEMREGFTAVNQRIDETNETMREGFTAVNQRIDETNETMRDQFAAVNQRIDETNETMRDQFAAVNQRIDETNRSLSERIDETNETMRDQFTAVNQRIDETNHSLGERIDENTRSIGVLIGQVGELRGESYERRCAEQIDAALIDHFDLAILADRTSINRQLVQARRNGLLTREEYEGGRNVDIIAQEQAEGETPSRLAAIEVSVTFNEDDLKNAAERAATIARITGIPTGAFLITRNTWPETIATVAVQSGVTIVRRY